MTDPDQDIFDFYNQHHGSSGSPTATMTPDPDQDIFDFYNQHHSPTPTTAPSRSPYTDRAVEQQGSTLSQISQIGTGTGAIQTVVGSAARGFLPGRAMLAAYPFGSVLGAAGVGALRGALVGAAVPVAGETGVSEVIGGVLGGLIAGGTAAWLAYKAQTKVADVVAPQTVFGSKAEQAQVAAHPYAAIVGGGLSFGKPNPMSVVRAGKTLASKEGRAALVAFNRTKGKGMSPQVIDEVGNVINVAQGGGLASAFNVKEQIESGHFDPGQLAVAAATGLIFNQPWFHKPNPAAAAAAKVMAKSGVPGVPRGTTPGETPPELLTPPGISPTAPRVPGLMDFETMPRPATEVARAPETPLPEAPIPRPGTETIPIPREGGETYAPEARQVRQGGEQEHIGVPQREDVSAHPEEVRTVGSEQAGYRGGTEPAPEEPVAFEDKLAQFKERLLTSKIAPREYKALRDSIMNEGKGGDFMGLTEDQRMAVLEVMNDVTLDKIQGKTPVKVDPRIQRLDEIDQEISDHYDREELPPPALHKERKAIEAELQKEHEAGLLAEAQGHQARGGDELLDAVAEHGVPTNDPEVKILKEHFAPKNKYGQEKHRPLATGTGEKLYFGDVFKADAGSMDSLTQFLKSKGFDVETPDDTKNLIDERLRTGKKVIGDEARAQALEEQSYEDYQGPMYAKHPFGGLFGKKEPEPPPNPKDYPGYAKTEHIEDPETLHNAIETDKGKGAEVVASTPGKDTLELGMNRKQIIRRLGQDAYKDSIVNVSVKELLQNAFDAVRGAGATPENPARIHVNVDPHARTIEVADQGTGMTPEMIKQGFFTIGGSIKETSPENTSGGIGVAKIAFMLGSRRIRLETVRDGLKSVIDATAEQIEDGTFDNIKTPTNEPNGTKVKVEIPETFVDANGETRHIYFERDPQFLKEPLFGPVEVIYNGAALPSGIYTKGWQKDNVFNFGWGHVDVHVDPRPTTNPSYKVMSAGLHQFDVSPYAIFGLNTETRIKHNMVFDVRSRVRADHPDYPFNNQREGFQGKRAQDVQDMWNYLKRQGVEQQLLAAREDFRKVQVLPELDIEKNLTPEDQAVIAEAFKEPKRPEIRGKGEQPKSVTFTPENVITTDQAGKQTTQTRKAYGIGERTFQPEREVNFEKTKLDVSNLDPNKPLFHNNTNADYSDIHGSHDLIAQLGNVLVKYMRHFGEKLPYAENYGELAETGPGGWFGGIGFDKTYGGLNMVNPFKSIWFNPGHLSVAGKYTPRAAAAETMHTFLHEITHLPQKNEGAGFTWELKNNYGRLEANEVEYRKYEKILENIYTKYWGAFNEAWDRFQSYDTRNRAESFKSGSQVGPESERGKGAGKGAPGEYVPEDVGVPEQRRTGPGGTPAPNPDAGPIGEILAGQKPAAPTGAEPVQPQIPAAPPVPEGVSGRGAVADIRDTLAGIKEAAAQPPETPEQRQFAPRPVETGDHEPRPLTPNEAAGPGLRDLSDQQMSQVISNSLQKFHEPGITTSLEASGSLSHNDIIDAGRQAIRHGVDPEAVAVSRAIPSEQKYTVVKAHAEDLREIAEQAEELARTHPTQANRDAAEAAFSDYSNWDKETVKPIRDTVDAEHPSIPPEEYNPRSMTDLRQQMIRQNNRDFTTAEKHIAEQRLKEVEKAVAARNKELMKRDAELAKESPDLVRDLSNGDDLFEYTAEVMKKLFPCK